MKKNIRITSIYPPVCLFTVCLKIDTSYKSENLIPLKVASRNDIKFASNFTKEVVLHTVLSGIYIYIYISNHTKLYKLTEKYFLTYDHRD